MADGLVMLHAWPLDGSMWSEQIALLGDRVPVIAPSMPGFGGTPSGGPVMSMDAAADAAVAAADQAGIERFMVCALSMGGYVALALWRRHAERVLGFVLANTRAPADDDAGKERRRALAERLRAEGSGFLLASPPALLSESADREVRRRVHEMMARQPADAIAAASLGMAERPDSTPDLAGIDVPTLIVTSTGDMLIPPEATSPMTHQIPGATLLVLDGAGHLSNLEAPAEFGAALEAHLHRCGLRA